MMRNTSARMGKPLTGVALVLFISAAVGVWRADEIERERLESLPSAESIPTAAPEIDETAYLEDIEQALAQAGCPGWMVLASEGEAALTPPEPIQQVAHTVTESEESNIPRVHYPVPVRVANRQQFSVALRDAHPVQSSPDDPDDLLDGMPDLLNVPRESEPSEEQSAPTERQAPVEEQPQTTEIEQPQVEEPKTIGVPRLELPQVEMPAATEEDSDRTETESAELPRPTVVDSQPVEPAPSAPSTTTPSQSPLFSAPGATQTPSVSPRPVVSQPEPQQPITEPLPQRPEPSPPPVSTPEPVPRPAGSPFAPPPTPQAPHSLGDQGKENVSRCDFVAEQCYPSAETCSKCHKKIYDEWRVSSHAYAFISPMFHKFEQKINELSQGTVGYFCYRCHSPVGTTMGISRDAPLWELPQVAREGVTCVACHRVNQRYGKVNGERRIEPGNIHAPVYGSIGGGGIAEVIAKKDHYKVKTSPHEEGPGQDIHTAGFYFDQLHKPEFCVSCHQVAVHPGIKLEVVWEQYRASPACKKGISCQDCHMGRIPGVPSGYEYGAAAEVNDKSVNQHRKHANHVFYGPGYSIAHPGIFPHNPDARRWSIRDWLQFEYRNGWGTEEFEKRLEAGQIRVSFPPVWQEVDDRYDAREIIEDNLEKLGEKAILRQQLMENGSHVDGPYFDSNRQRGQDLKFHYIITNTNEGHNLPSGSLGAQPQLWANVVLIGPRGNRLWESGYTDRWGDVADIHSVEVRNKKIPYDWQLFNLQTMFLITGAKGTDREFFLPVNVDFDQLPFLRPGAQPISVINHPPFIRMEGRSLAPLGSRKVPYKVPAHLMQEPGCYRLSFRMRSRAEPIYFMRFCESTREMERAMNEWMIDFHQSSVEFIVR